MAIFTDCSQPPLLVIVGPTAVGKTALSLDLARRFAVEIISADSRQIYRQCDIGTAKPTPAELALAPHHLIDVVDPDQILALAEFQELAYAAIAAIHGRGRLPLLVGGTGQWVKAVVEGWRIPRVPPDMAYRAELEARAAAHGAESLYAELAAVDALAAQKIDPRNLRRVIRALEVYHKTGIPISEHQQKSQPPYRILQLGVTMPRDMLYARLDARIDSMMAQGLLAEVNRLAAQGYGWQMPAMMGLGYRQIGQYVRGEVTLEEAVALIKKETRRFVRQQYNWFRLEDETIHWLDMDLEPEARYEEAAALVAQWVRL
jgi:tRNA dimethylallyltransferase